MAYLSCSSCGLGVLRRANDAIDAACPQCGRAAAVLPGLVDGRVLPDFSCELDTERDSAVVRPRGELDLMTSEQLEHQLERLLAVRIRHLVLDLSRLTFIDSSGIRLLIAFAQRAGSDGFDFELIRGTEDVQRVLEIGGVVGALPFRDDCAA